MTLKELLSSPDPFVRLRAEVRSFSDAATWISTGHLSQPACLADSPAPKPASSVKFHTSLFEQLTVSNAVTLMVNMGDEGADGAYDRMYHLIDSDNMYSDVVGKIWYCGTLNTHDWPFLTTEIVAHFLYLQKKSGRTNVPSLVAAHMHHFFKDVNYSELLNWYQNDMLTLTPGNEALPLLSDVMFERALLADAKIAELPPDMSL